MTDQSDTSQVTTPTSERIAGPKIKDLVENHGKEMQYLFELRTSGATNMFGAGIYLAQTFDIPQHQATKILSAWMTNFQELAEYYNYKV